MKYWIGVVSKEHVLCGIKDGIMQLGHGKRAPLARLAKDDWIIYYSPTVKFGDKTPLQAFTALGQVVDDEIFQVAMSEDFAPYRRRVNYQEAVDMPIRPLIDDLSFIKSKQSWGYAFRFGLIQIPKDDFELIKNSMLLNT